ncbi:MAG TPA: TPM domain-containing protein [Acidobacteriaceae bacterium]|nr:TPM domain-containing protein [Acidobacteriaceae bacterium]
MRFLRLPVLLQPATILKRAFASVLFCAIPLLLVPSAPAERVRDLRPTGYVNDFAGVLSTVTRNQLETLCTEVDRQAHAQIAVITIHTTGDDSIDDFAVRLEEKWKVGPKGTDRGLLLLVATDDHKYRFEVGYGLEGILPDGKVGTIGREMVPYLRQGDYDAAVSLGVRDASQVIAQDAGVTLHSPVQNYAPQRSDPVRGVRDLLLALFAIFAFISLMRSGSSGWAGFLLGTILGNLLGGGGGRGGGFGGGGGDGDGGFGGFGGGSSGGGGASGSW